MGRVRKFDLAVLLLLGAGAALSFGGLGDGARAVPVLPDAVAEAEPGHLPFGPVRPPRGLPAIAVETSDGEVADLHRLLTGHWTLAQLVFTGCSTTCPVQGAIFQDTQVRLAEAGLDVRLLSISVDPLGDTPALLDQWLERAEAGARWQAALPKLADLGALLDALHGRGDGVDVHNARVYLIDPQVRLAYVTEELPSPAALVVLTQAALRQGNGS